MILMPIFVLMPWVAFRHVEETARAVRISEIDEILNSQSLDVNNIGVVAPFIAGLDRCVKAKISPLRLGTASLSTYIIAVFLPVVIAAAEIFFPNQARARVVGVWRP
jgi:hypothetical protein